ncbi:MAG: dihydrolipoyllysine-residue acetyltransferase [Leptospiraceae bacterium]|nr:dihydrolipoyllysine-residue acetyltransferase [Leptospiraceae bacterium]MCP5497164.1 dihydrolipoyllysine-residue acetyltransferase [Leptospiraceae bacterium]
MIKDVSIPDIGNFKDIPIVDLFIKVGDKVKKEDPLVSLESDKATMEIPAPYSGEIKEIKVKIKDKVSEGMVILSMDVVEEEAKVSSSEPPPVEVSQATTQQPIQAAKTIQESVSEQAPLSKTGLTNSHATPSIRKMARELGVNLSEIKGSGPKERIIKQDIQNYVKSVMKGSGGRSGDGIPQIPPIDFSKFGEIETIPLPRIKKLSGPHLHRSWLNIPHVTQFDEADITELEEFRKSLKQESEKRGLKVTLLAFLVKASVYCLKTYPDFNSSLDPSGESLIYKKYYNIGVAVDTPEGLVVPVIKKAESKSIFDIATELGTLSSKARDRKLSSSDIEGASFSISSLGGVGGTAFTPIVNAPEVAILGVSKSSIKPIFQNGTFVPRLMLPLSLSYDHRAIDGASAARFTTFLSSLLSDIRKLLL